MAWAMGWQYALNIILTKIDVKQYFPTTWKNPCIWRSSDPEVLTMKFQVWSFLVKKRVLRIIKRKPFIFFNKTIRGKGGVINMNEKIKKIYGSKMKMNGNTWGLSHVYEPDKSWSFSTDVQSFFKRKSI